MDCNIDGELFDLIIKQDVESDECEKENSNENVENIENFLISRKPSQQQYEMMHKFIGRCLSAFNDTHNETMRVM